MAFELPAGALAFFAPAGDDPALAVRRPSPEILFDANPPPLQYGAKLKSLLY
ncbi:hypothetical protein JQ620_09245 [Bradyrhizobium sp. AUGA SZCCT0274]|uniref:hypothetical protein n=1 Tax=Bradyrhizobium sp. AUGA SZCCT0274 TaxID=2807670 RepID=UPI001BAD7ECF|nr:hypothetical protein [Bradyrhizobium sp. AUGA SZCCT0274]MBR1240309.1 hypothetical protein [Bradyrhizobium sp. AUGA SZCCT0274]